MIIETHDRFDGIKSTKATRALIRAENGTPVALILELADSLIEVRTARDPNFVAMLRTLGVSDLPTVRVLSAPVPGG